VAETGERRDAQGPDSLSPNTTVGSRSNKRNAVQYYSSATSPQAVRCICPLYSKHYRAVSTRGPRSVRKSDLIRSALYHIICKRGRQSFSYQDVLNVLSALLNLSPQDVRKQYYEMLRKVLTRDDKDLFHRTARGQFRVREDCPRQAAERSAKVLYKMYILDHDPFLSVSYLYDYVLPVPLLSVRLVRDVLGISYEASKKLLQRLAKKGVLKRIRRGLYEVLDVEELSRRLSGYKNADELLQFVESGTFRAHIHTSLLHRRPDFVSGPVDRTRKYDIIYTGRALLRHLRELLPPTAPPDRSLVLAWLPPKASRFLQHRGLAKFLTGYPSSNPDEDSHLVLLKFEPITGTASLIFQGAVFLSPDSNMSPQADPPLPGTKTLGSALLKTTSVYGPYFDNVRLSCSGRRVVVSKFEDVPQVHLTFSALSRYMTKGCTVEYAERSYFCDAPDWLFEQIAEYLNAYYEDLGADIRFTPEEIKDAVYSFGYAPLEGRAGLKMEHRSPAKIKDYTDLVKVLVLDDIAGVFHWICLTLRFMRTEPTALQHLLEEALSLLKSPVYSKQYSPLADPTLVKVSPDSYWKIARELGVDLLDEE